MSVDGLAVNVAAVTLSVTGMLAGLPVAPVDVTVTAPVYIPAVRPVVLIEMLTDDDGETVPLPGVAESQEDPPLEVVKEIPGVPVMLTA